MRRNVKGITREYTETDIIVSLKNIGMNPDINAVKSEASAFLVMCLDIRKTTKTNVGASRLGMTLAAQSGSMKMPKKAKR